jgi:hypothetical protein
MKPAHTHIRHLGSTLLTALLLSACGGGGGSSNSGSGGSPSDPPGGGTPPPADTALPTVMSCIDGDAWQCSGSSIIRTDNGVAMTRSGVQVYGRSTSDLAPVIVEKTGAFGFQLASGGVAEIRLSKDAGDTVANATLLLRNLGLSWDGKVERPPIVDPFLPTQGRTTLDANGALTFSALPPSSDLGFYNFATLGPNATQANYADNRYFPRQGNPSRCQPGMSPCPTAEITGAEAIPGDWRTGGIKPDWTSAGRLHGDGDIHAGDGPPDANGNPTVLVGGNGPGVPFPGSKGFRSLSSWSYKYSNLSAWFTQDTVIIEEWAALGNEHNKNRRGMVTFGDVTTPSAVPATGSASYSGFAYGWYGESADSEPEVFYGRATATANFATGQVTVTLNNTVTFNAAETLVPVTFSAVTAAGAANGDLANYMTGPASTTAMTGGVSGRYFGPVITSGSSGVGPAEIGGSFSMSSSATGQAVVGGFIALKQ